MTVREAHAADLLHFAAVFADAVRTAGPSRYTPEQVDAWVRAADNPEAFGRQMLAARTFVAEDERGVAGFVTVEPDGRVAMLHVRGDRQRRGLGSRLLAVAVRAAVEGGAERAYAEASAFSLPLFLREGFAVVEAETVVRAGVTFERHRVERRLRPGRPGP